MLYAVELRVCTCSVLYTEAYQFCTRYQSLSVRSDSFQCQSMGFASNMNHLAKVVSSLDQRRGRCANIDPTLGGRVVIAGIHLLHGLKM